MWKIKKFFCHSDFTWNHFWRILRLKIMILAESVKINWILREFTLTLFWQKFRESNVFANKVTKDLISRKKFQCGKTWNSLLRKSFSSNQFCVKFCLGKKLIWRNFCARIVAVKLRKCNFISRKKLFNDNFPSNWHNFNFHRICQN